MKKQPSESESQWWWLENHSTVKRSPWLQSTLTELNEKTKGMLKLIEEDADSFAQRAEMYYKKRPELVSMVEDFYRTHRSLAEKYDQVRPETTGIRPFSSASFKHHQADKLMSFEDNGYDSYSENCDVVESLESEVDDPEHEQEHEENAKFVDYKEQQEVQFVNVNDAVLKLRKEIEGFGEEKNLQKDQMKQKGDIGGGVVVLREEIERLRKENEEQKDQLKQKDTICDEVMMLRKETERVRKENKAQKDDLKKKDTVYGEVMMLRKEIERVREENKAQKNDLKQKDNEKIEVIRQLSATIDVLKQENVKMRGFIAKFSTKKWKTPFEFNKLIGSLSGKLLSGIPKNKPSIVAL